MLAPSLRSIPGAVVVERQFSLDRRYLTTVDAERAALASLLDRAHARAVTSYPGACPGDLVTLYLMTDGSTLEAEHRANGAIVLRGR